MSVKRKVTVPVGRPSIGGLRSSQAPAEGTFGDRSVGSSEYWREETSMHQQIHLPSA
jgi:hypothetical protein